MDNEMKEKLRSMAASIYSGIFILLAVVSFLGFNVDKSQSTFWLIVGLGSSLFCLVSIVKDLYDTFKYKKENKGGIKNG
jgi:hypothetical protein